MKILEVAENRKLMEEEAQMIETETLMRYIRVLSELSNQIRYSSQKRVLVEVALIKLCRPEMETNLDSVLDRIRVLEKKMEQGIPMMQAPASAGVSQQAAPVVQSTPEEKPEKAATQDLQTVMAQWKSIVGETSGFFKKMLQNSDPKYNGQTGEPVLYVVMKDQILGPKCVNDPEYKETLEEIIRNRIGKTVEVEILLAEQHQKVGLAQISVDKIIEENINMDIITEDDPEL